ncbi:flagellar basal body P-ring formation chaperone FlgA [Caminibacter sp.]
MIFLILPLFLFASVKEEIVNFYKKTYPKINIISITSNKPFPKTYKSIKILLCAKSASGNILIDKKYYFIRIKATIPVYKALKIIKQNSPIIPGVNVKKETVKFRYFYSPPLSQIPKNLIASKIIGKNAVINKSNTKISPDVLKNSTVSVIISSSNIQIYSKAKALKDGNIGDTIPIEMNKKIFKAKIIDKNSVSIE